MINGSDTTSRSKVPALGSAFALLASIIIWVARDSVAAQAQSVEAFLGEWKGNAELNQTVALGGMIRPDYPMTISKTGSALTVARGTGAAQTISYPLDGSPADVTWQNRPATAKLGWNGSALTLQLKAKASDAVWETMTLEAPRSGRLVVHASVSRPSGQPLQFDIFLDRVSAIR